MLLYYKLLNINLNANQCFQKYGEVCGHENEPEVDLSKA